MRRNMRCPPIVPRLLVVLPILLTAVPAGATYSVVATDQATAQVGGATTSCVGIQSVATVFGPAPGHGGINAQAAQNIAGRNQGQALLNMDVDPAEIIRQITAAAFDPNAATRQYGIADLSGRAAGFTGASAMDYKEDRHGTFGTFTYSVQGNILTGKIVLDQAEAAFRARGCDLADRLMFALEGGAQNNQGDRRCNVDAGVPSDSASIEVDLSGAPARSYLFLSLSGTGNVSPLIRLRSMFDTWRQTHPCPSDAGVADAGARDASSVDAGTRTDANADARDASGGGAGGAGATGGSSGAGGGGTSGGSSGASGATGSTATTVGTGGSATGAGATGSTAGSGGGASGGRSNGAGADDGGGCACRAARPVKDLPGKSILVLAIIAVGTARRRRRQSRSVFERRSSPLRN